VIAKADALAFHLDACRFNEANAVYAAIGESAHDAAEFASIALFGQRLLRLDLVDIGLGDEPLLAAALPAHLERGARPLHFPETPEQRDRGALDDVPALFSHILEAFEIRWRRGDMLQVVALLHLVGEYVGHLAWHRVLGHSADPARLRDSVAGRDSRWGKVDANDCGHGRPQRHLARKVNEGDMLKSSEAWVSFLRSDYSRLGEQLLVCASRRSIRPGGRRARTCDAPCSVWTSIDEQQRIGLERSARIAVWFRGSPVVGLRHGAPVGHFFGVPDKAEVLEAWATFLKTLARREDVHVKEGTLPEQLNDVVGQIAGHQVRAGTLIAEAVVELRRLADA
jgi:hypothetical protein